MLITKFFFLKTFHMKFHYSKKRRQLAWTTHQHTHCPHTLLLFTLTNSTHLACFLFSPPTFTSSSPHWPKAWDLVVVVFWTWPVFCDWTRPSWHNVLSAWSSKGMCHRFGKQKKKKKKIPFSPETNSFFFHRSKADIRKIEQMDKSNRFCTHRVRRRVF